MGALQGAADTVRTVSSMVGSPLFAEVFSRCMSEAVRRPHWTLRFISIASISALALFVGLICTTADTDGRCGPSTVASSAVDAAARA